MLKFLLGIYSLFCLNTERCEHPLSCWARDPIRECGQLAAMYVTCCVCGASWFEVLDTPEKQQQNWDLEL